MPATCGVVSFVLNQILDKLKVFPKSFLDIGCGTGGATWACEALINFDKISCFERENAMIDIAKKLMQKNDKLKDAEWKNFDLLKDEINTNSDLVILSYVLNEISKDNYANILSKLWNATNQILIIIEPGTPKGFENLSIMRNWFLEKDANILAPCPHQNKCPRTSPDWCNFSTRIARSKYHKFLKNADAPFEDEKLDRKSVV